MPDCCFQMSFHFRKAEEVFSPFIQRHKLHRIPDQPDILYRTGNSSPVELDIAPANLFRKKFFQKPAVKTDKIIVFKLPF